MPVIFDTAIQSEPVGQKPLGQVWRNWQLEWYFNSAPAPIFTVKTTGSAAEGIGSAGHVVPARPGMSKVLEHVAGSFGDTYRAQGHSQLSFTNGYHGFHAFGTYIPSWTTWGSWLGIVEWYGNGYAYPCQATIIVAGGPGTNFDIRRNNNGSCQSLGTIPLRRDAWLDVIEEHQLGASGIYRVWYRYDGGAWIQAANFTGGPITDVNGGIPHCIFLNYTTSVQTTMYRVGEVFATTFADAEAAAFGTGSGTPTPAPTPTPVPDPGQPTAPANLRLVGITRSS